MADRATSIFSGISHVNDDEVSRFQRCAPQCLKCRAIEWLIINDVPYPVGSDDLTDWACVEEIIAQVGGALLANEHPDVRGQFTQEEEE